MDYGKCLDLTSYPFIAHDSRIKLTVGPTPPTVLGPPPRGVTRWVSGDQSKPLQLGGAVSPPGKF